jgi:DNA-binding response OmpR family regulator/chromosome segregation ATPase
MDQRRILVVEAETDFADQIRTALEPYNLVVEVTGDGTDGLQRAKGDPPDLILLCVELPNMSGYSICNKLKKNPELKRIPLVIMSKDATPDIFEQHKKLKTRAEDYLIKPFPMDDLLGKMDALLGLEADPGAIGQSTTREYGEQPSAPPPPPPAPGVPVATVAEDDEDLEEIEVTEEDMEEEAGEPLDGPLGEETDAAFDSLEMPAGKKEGAGMELLLPSEAAHEDGMRTKGEPVTAPPVEALPLDDGENSIELETRSLAQKMLEGEVEGASIQPVETTEEQSSDDELAQPDLPAPPKVDLVADGKLRRQLEELEDENRRLNDELQSAKSRASESAGPVSRDKELLNLREVINKKEKEALDLKDDINSKERQILDHKDKVRELERKVRDMDEQALGVEREMLSANERLTALQEDKEKLQEREKGIKARLSEAKDEIDKAYAEIDGLKKKNQQDAEAAQSERLKLEQEHEEEVTGLQDRQAGELARLKREREEAEQALREEHTQALEQAAQDKAQALEQAAQDKAQALEQAAQDKAQALEQAEQTRADNIAELKDQHRQELESQSESHRQAMEQQAEQHAQNIEAERAAAEEKREELSKQHQGEMQAQREEHEQAVDQLKNQHADEVTGLRDRQRQELEQKDADHAGEKEALRTEHRAATEKQQQEHEEEQTRLKAELAQQLEEAEQSHQDQITGMERRHGAQVEELEANVSGKEHEIGELSQELSVFKQKLEETEEQVRGLEADLQATRERVAEQEQKIKEHEEQATAYQDQLMKAFEKIRNDEALAEKAKRAIAIAASLLEEQKKVTAPEAEQPH